MKHSSLISEKRLTQIEDANAIMRREGNIQVAREDLCADIRRLWDENKSLNDEVVEGFRTYQKRVDELEAQCAKHDTSGDT